MGYLECLFIALLVFIVIGPKDFPKIMFTLGDLWRRLKVKSQALYTHLEDLSERDDKSRKK